MWVCRRSGTDPPRACAAFHHVLDFRGVHAGVVVRGPVQVGVELFVGDGDAQVVAEGFEVFHGEFLHLVGRVAALEVGSESVALDGLGQDHGGFALEFGRGFVRGVDLAVVVAAAFEVPDLVVVRSATMSLVAGVFPKKCSRTNPPDSAL